MMKQSGDNITNLLWTGGWDSTFRLLELVLDKHRPVQTYYLIDTNRRSIRKEIKTLRKIKDQLFEHYPHTQNLIYPTRFTEIGDLIIDQEIIEAYKTILMKRKIGRQYTWLSQFCQERDLDDIELCVGVMPDSGVVQILNPLLENVIKHSEKNYRVKVEHYDTSEGTIFKYYSFPLFKFSKLKMKQISEERGWMPIMKLTWFCHTPIFGIFPCGICVPCTDAFNENMEWRHPVYLRFLNSIKVLDVLRMIRKSVLNKKYQQL